MNGTKLVNRIRAPWSIKFKDDKRFPIGSQNLRFIRTTNRWGEKGTLSNNRGYLRVARNFADGKFCSLVEMS